MQPAVRCLHAADAAWVGQLIPDDSKCAMAALKGLLQDTASRACASASSMLYHLPARDTSVSLGWPQGLTNWARALGQGQKGLLRPFPWAPCPLGMMILCIPSGSGDGVQGIDAQDQKTCDTDEGGCGQLWPIQRCLEGEAAPVFTLQLAWESHAESSEAIAEVLDTVQEVCSPRQMSA